MNEFLPFGSYALPANRLIYLPQEISLSESKTLLTELRALPKSELGRLMSVVSSLGSDPEGVLRTSAPSPGEIRKLMLACGIIKEPHLIVMDEPTNHLDLPSIGCIETALTECPVALLLVSHDRVFVEKLTDIEWAISGVAGNRNTNHLQLQISTVFST